MCKTPFLETPDFKKTFIVECYALDHGIGAIFMQEGSPFSFENIKIKGKNLLIPI